MQEPIEILLITGLAGIGKSTLYWEIGAQLATTDVPHAIIETDELDRVLPRPTAEQLNSLRPGTTDVSALNLAAMWGTYRALGHTRLIMSGVMPHLKSDYQWISQAIPNARITAVRLVGSESTLLTRLDQREIGSGRDEQAQRSLRQLKRISNEPPGAAVIIQPTTRRRQSLREWSCRPSVGRESFLMLRARISPSLRGAKRRSNPARASARHQKMAEFELLPRFFVCALARAGLLRFARNDVA